MRRANGESSSDVNESPKPPSAKSSKKSGLKFEGLRIVRLNYRTATAAFAALCASTIGIRAFCLHPGKHGGEGAGIFFLIFIILVAICVVPMIALESVLGQFRHGGETGSLRWGFGTRSLMRNCDVKFS